MDGVPLVEAPDENDIAISTQITKAKFEILIPIQTWILVKLIILSVVNIVALMNGTDMIFMDYYITSFDNLVLLFYLFPESVSRIYTTFFSANMLTRGVQYYLDGFACVLVVSLISWFFATIFIYPFSVH